MCYNLDNISKSLSPATIDSNTTNVNFSVDLNNPNDYYEFNVDVVNKGSIDAMLSDVLKTEINANLAKYFDYTVTYSDGDKPTKKDLLSAGGKEKINVKVIYKNEDELPTDDQNLNLSLTMTYVQADDSAVLRPIAYPYQMFDEQRLGANGTIDTTDPDQIFITGTDPNNYVWYSGKLWRAVSIDTSDNSVKIITQDILSAISFNEENNTSFHGSYIEDWLNNTDDDGFLSTLYNYSNYIKMDSKWNATTSVDDYSKPAKTTIITDPVGLLNVYEFYMTDYDFNNNYLMDDKYDWWTISPSANYSDSVCYFDARMYYMSYGGTIYDVGVRPVINLKSDVLVSSGDGSINNPYKLKGDTSATKNDKLNTRNGGEYVKFNDAIYRIVNVEGNKTKIMATQSVAYEEFDGQKNVLYDPTRSTNIGYYLNNDWYNSLTLPSQNMIEVGTWYRGSYYWGQSYRLAKDTTTNPNINAKVGLMRYGELMTGILIDYHNPYSYWTITPYGSLDEVLTLGEYGLWRSFYYEYVIPSIYLKSDVYITSGTGLPNDPYILSQ